MIECDAELCPYWAGFGCVCAALDIDPYDPYEDEEVEDD